MDYVTIGGGSAAESVAGNPELEGQRVLGGHSDRGSDWWAGPVLGEEGLRMQCEEVHVRSIVREAVCKAGEELVFLVAQLFMSCFFDFLGAVSQKQVRSQG